MRMDNSECKTTDAEAQCLAPLNLIPRFSEKLAALHDVRNKHMWRAQVCLTFNINISII